MAKPSTKGGSGGSTSGGSGGGGSSAGEQKGGKPVLENAPSTTGRKSGGKRGNLPQKPKKKD
jgi:hypothetical protein